MYDTEELLGSARSAGARGIVPKSKDGEIVNAIKAITRDHVSVS